MAVYQETAKQRIRKSLRKFRTIAARERANAVNEADTRVLVTAVLSEALGWDPFEEVTGEHLIRGQYCDFVIKQNGGMFAIVEVKAIAIELSPKHLYQAVGYAANEGVDWVVLTNGAAWQLYRVLFEKPVSYDLVLEVSLLDEETPPAAKTELLYLLSKEAQRAGELDAYYQKKAALCGTNIAKALLGAKVLNALRLEMRRLYGHNVSPQELATILVAEVFRADLQGETTAQLLLKAAAQSRRAAGSPRAAARSETAKPEDQLAKASDGLRPVAKELLAYLESLGPEVAVKPMSSYIAFRTKHNFCCFDVHAKHLLLSLELDPALAGDCSPA